VPGDKEYGYQEPQQRENPAQANKNYITELWKTAFTGMARSEDEPMRSYCHSNMTWILFTQIYGQQWRQIPVPASENGKLD
jgi:hypothetical protein